jgi:hypothetical protein
VTPADGTGSSGKQPNAAIAGDAVFADDATEAENLKLRAALIRAIRSRVDENGWSVLATSGDYLTSGQVHSDSEQFRRVHSRT